ncbi:hypothetical protein quinque_008514 [Culex quinquefasciatus]
MRVEMNLDIQETGCLRDDIDSRIAEFKQDPEKMSELGGFVDEVLNEAQKSAEDKLQDKSADDRPRNDTMERFTFVILVLFLKLLGPSDGAMTMKQLKNSLEMMRKACAPKFKVDDASLNELTAGNFRSDPDPELKCYTLTKKGEISLSKTTAQIDAMLPNEMKAFAKEAMTACKDAQAGYKETCDKIYYSVKCVAEFNKDAFLFP